MNKWMIRLGSLLVTISLLFGCAPGDSNEVPVDNNNQEEINANDQNEEVVTITISTDDGEEMIAKKEVTIEDGAILMDVLKENFEIEEEGGFINSIDGISQNEDEGKYWLYSVNGEDANVGANEFELTSGDDVVFDLHALD